MEVGGGILFRESFKAQWKGTQNKSKNPGKSRYSKCCISFIGITV
jgi:hypothetical protein